MKDLFKNPLIYIVILLIVVVISFAWDIYVLYIVNKDTPINVAESNNLLKNTTIKSVISNLSTGVVVLLMYMFSTDKNVVTNIRDSIRGNSNNHHTFREDAFNSYGE